MRVLVIDDEAPLLRVVKRLLSGVCEVATAESASDALVLLAEGSFDVILADLHLPGMDGRELLARLSPLAAARVVFMTGGACNEGEHEFLAGRETLWKPFEPEALDHVIGAARGWNAA